MNKRHSFLKNNFKPKKNIRLDRNEKYLGKDNLGVLFNNHKRAFLDSLNNLYHASISNLLTIFILGVTLALPILLHLIVYNINSGLSLWQSNLYQYSVYLDSSSSTSTAKNLSKHINSWPEIASTQIIFNDQGLNELKQFMGLENILNEVNNNPLPHVVIVKIKAEYQNLATLKELITRSQKINGISNIDADVFWLEKISKILQLSFIAIYIFSLSLGLAVLLVIGNTIRLNLQAKQLDMSIFSLLGASAPYIRRPYLYGGLLYGLFTGMIAIAISKLLFNKLHVLVNEIGYTELFNNNITTITTADAFTLLALSSMLGWLGARITLYWQLKRIQNKLVEL